MSGKTITSKKKTENKSVSRFNLSFLRLHTCGRYSRGKDEWTRGNPIEDKSPMEIPLDEVRE